MRKKTARTITPGTKKKGGKEQAIKLVNLNDFGKQ